MRTLSFSVIFFLMATLPAFAGSGGALEEWTLLGPSVKYFSWEEFRDDGSRVLKEEGALVGIGASFRINLLRRFLNLKSKVELFGGDVHYNGHTQPDPDPALSERPVKTNVVYFGTMVENDLGLRYASGAVSLEPFAGLGYRWWIRSLANSATADTGEPVGGATEYWQTVYTRVGARGAWRLTRGVELFAEGGGKYPFHNENRADIGSGSFTVKPKGEWSAFGEVGVSWKRLRTSVYYEGFRFSRSDVVPIGGNVGVFQPKTDSDIVGLNINWLF